MDVTNSLTIINYVNGSVDYIKRDVITRISVLNAGPETKYSKLNIYSGSELIFSEYTCKKFDSYEMGLIHGFLFNDELVYNIGVHDKTEINIDKILDRELAMEYRDSCNLHIIVYPNDNNDPKAVTKYPRIEICNSFINVRSPFSNSLPKEDE